MSYYISLVSRLVGVCKMWKSRHLWILILVRISIATHVIPLRVARRLSDDGVRIFGGVASDGYIACTIWVGEDAQPFDVVLDTGSPLTIVPCNTCTHCGDHSYYHPSRNAHWGHSFRIHYVEGSRLEGNFLNTQVRIHETVIPSAQIGCASVMTNQFRSQHADGILGLDADGILETYMARNHGEPKTFALSLSPTQDRLLLGLEPTHSDVVCPMFTHTENFYINFHSLHVDGHALHPSHAMTRLLIDSGTTYIYLKRALFQSLRSLLQSQYGFHSSHSSEIGCVSSLNHVPEPLLIDGGEGCHIVLRPHHWIVLHPNGYCAAIYDTGYGNDNTFGLIALEDRETTFVFGTHPEIRMNEFER